MDDLDERRLRVLELAADGVPYRDIERQTGENRGTISRWVTRDLSSFEAARALGETDLGELGDLVAGIEGDVLGRARAVVVQQTVRMLHAVVVSDATPLRDRLTAADRLRSWVETRPTLEDTIPPLPDRPPSGPAWLPCGVCHPEPCTRCDAARWTAWVERVVWARRQPLATDRSAVRAGGALITDAQAAAWLEQGAADIAAGHETPAADFAGRFAAAAGDALATLLAEHAEALGAGDARTAAATQSVLEALMPSEYQDEPEPLTSENRESDIGRVLRLIQPKRKGRK